MEIRMQERNKEQAKKFLQWVNNNYNNLKEHHKAYCMNTKQKWDDDIFCDTYLKIYEKIAKDGINDDSDRGFECYLFKSFKMNTLREAMYARNQKKDGNNANLTLLQERYLNSKLTEQEKLKSDLYKDFSSLYMLLQLEDNFKQEDLRLFKMKMFTNITYKQLAEKTNEKQVRQRVVMMKNYLKENVTKEMLDKAFEEIYGDLVY